jgi:hypothetical protein
MEPVATTWRSSSWARWLGWTLLYTLLLWSLWAVAALLAARADALTTTLWVWIIAFLAPFGLAMIGGLAVEASWWTTIPPLVVGLSLLALTAATWLNPAFAYAVAAADVVTVLFGPAVEQTRVFLGREVERTGVFLLLLGLTMLAPLLAYGLARIGLGISQSTAEPLRGALRNFARWLLIAVPLVMIGLATGDGTAVVLGAGALYVAGWHIGVRIELWRYFE